MTFVNMESMNNNAELNFDVLNTVNGGNFFADLEDVLRKIFADDKKPTQPNNQTSPEPVTARGNC